MKLAVVFGFCMLLLGPNLLWLNWSTVRIENRGSQSIEEAILFVCEQPVSLGSLAPGASRFRFLPKCGDDSLEIRTGRQSTNCKIYVEGEMYHVRAWFTSPTTGDCTYGGSPPLTPLLLTELF
ncbi:MAG: hypothetical protein HP495_08350 [Nitrospira sp.]|nr:hypothetical protein [Nitrospira sp.]